jgi:hypothetical protein
MIDLNKVQEDTAQKLDDILATSSSQQILEFIFSQTLDFDSLSQYSLPSSEQEAKQIYFQKKLLTLFLNKLMYILMTRLNFFKLTDDPDDYLYFNKKSFSEIKTSNI